MVAIGVDLFTAAVAIIGFFSHLLNEGFELFTMTREALKMALDSTSVKRNLQRLQDLATAYRDKTLSQLGKDAIDDCVKNCTDTYGAIEEKLLKIQRSTTKVSRAARAVWQSNALKELRSKMELSNSKLRDVLIMSHLQAGLDNAVRKEVRKVERSFTTAQSRSSQNTSKNQDPSEEEEEVVRQVHHRADIKGSQVSTLPATKTITKIYDGSVAGGETATQLSPEQQSRIRSIKTTVTQTVEETPTSRKASVEKSTEYTLSTGQRRPITYLAIGAVVGTVLLSAAASAVQTM